MRIFVADDHTLLRQGLCKILEEQPGWEVVGQASNGRDAMRDIPKLEPNVAIIDIGIPQLNGIEVTRQLTKRMPALHVLILSMHSEEAYIANAMQSGAQGYLLKDCADTELIGAVTAVAAGKSYFSPAVARIMLDDYVRQIAQRGIVDRYESLSDREREIFQLIAEGHTNKDTAQLLSISAATVETHRAHIFQKLDVHSTAELVLYAVRRGVIA
ncbi:MAG: response regulator transcription factor [Vicinamibacterales bacterium]